MAEELPNAKNIKDFYKRADLSQEDLTAWFAEEGARSSVTKKRSQEAIREINRGHEQMQGFLLSRQGLNKEKKPLNDQQRASQDAARAPKIKVFEKFAQSMADLEKKITNYNPDTESLNVYVIKVEELTLSQLEAHESEAVEIVKTRYESLRSSCGATGMKIIMVKGTAGNQDFTSLPGKSTSAPNHTSKDKKREAQLPTWYGVVEQGKPIPIAGDIVQGRQLNAQAGVGNWYKILSHLGVSNKPFNPKGAFDGAGRATVGPG